MRWPTNMEKYVSEVKAFLEEAGGEVLGVSVSKRAHLMLGSKTYKKMDVEAAGYDGSVELNRVHNHVREASLSVKAYFDSLDKVPPALDVDVNLCESLMEPDDITVKAGLGKRHGYEMTLDIHGRDVNVFGKEVGDGDDRGYDAECEKLAKLMKKHGFEMAILQG